MREMSRLQLLVEVLQRVHRMLSEEDQEHYKEDFESYLQGTSGQYVYRIRGEESAAHLRAIGELMSRLVEELRDDYGQQASYRMLVRVFEEHFIFDDEEGGGPRPIKGEELSAGSLPWSGSSTVAG